METKFRLSKELIDTFPLENHLYSLIVKDNECTVTWEEDGELEANAYYSIDEVNRNFEDGSWVKVEELEDDPCKLCGTQRCYPEYCDKINVK